MSEPDKRSVMHAMSVFSSLEGETRAHCTDTLCRLAKIYEAGSPLMGVLLVCSPHDETVTVIGVGANELQAQMIIRHTASQMEEAADATKH